MLRAANRFCLRLWRDESGVVLAITVVVFLTLFMIGCAVYAIGEVVRERIELQNAADSAAYSGALVQADALSRIGAINRAMAWTYGQMCRMEQDYVVDKWLELVLRKFWQEDYVQASTWNYAGACNFGAPTFFWVGVNQGLHKYVRLNGHHIVSVSRIASARAGAAASFPGKSHYTLGPLIDDCRDNIKAMNKAEKNIIGIFPKKITDAVEDVLSANVRDLENDRVSPAGSADLRYKLLPDEGVHKTYFDIETDEMRFLRFIDWVPSDLGKGVQGGWYEKKPARGIKRGYRRGHHILRAEWSWWSSKWILVEGVCTLVGIRTGNRLGANVRAIMGDDGSIYSRNHYETELAEPRKLLNNFFGEDGTIVVGVARRMNNPWQFVVAGRAPGDRGIFNMSTLDNDRRFMWAAAAARAGYKLKRSSRERPGWYETTNWIFGPDDRRYWNIKWSDWDVVMLPLRRGWTYGTYGQWAGDITGGQILTKLAGGGWKAVPPRGSGGGLGFQGGPELMGGGTVNYGGANRIILH